MARIVKWRRNGPYAILVEGKNQVFFAVAARRARCVTATAPTTSPRTKHRTSFTGTAAAGRIAVDSFPDISTEQQLKDLPQLDPRARLR